MKPPARIFTSVVSGILVYYVATKLVWNLIAFGLIRSLPEFGHIIVGILIHFSVFLGGICAGFISRPVISHSIKALLMLGPGIYLTLFGIINPLMHFEIRKIPGYLLAILFSFLGVKLGGFINEAWSLRRKSA